METHDEARDASGGDPGTTMEPLPESPVVQSAQEPANSGPDHETNAASEAETVAPVVYDPTPVIRGYDTSEGEAPVAIEPVVSATLPSAAASEQDALADQVASPTTAAQAPPVADLATPVAATLTPPVVVTPVVVDTFKSRVRDTWSLMFGSRYEDEDGEVRQSEQEADTKPPADTSHEATTPKTMVSTTMTRSSCLRSKLDLGRQLDQQLQGGRRTRVRPRPVDTQQTPQTARISSARPRKAEETWLAEEQPFQDAGLSPTIVRFCLEKAMLSTVHCLAQLHAIVQNEPEPARGDVELGVFLTQWELDLMLHDLFDTTPKTAVASSSSGRMCLHNADYASLPLETLLQVSWFMPLDQLPRLRSLVAQIGRKHLSERKLAVLNAALHRHFVLRPHPGVKMQRLLLRTLDALVPKQSPPTRQPHGNQADNEATDKEAARQREQSQTLVLELLHAIYVRIPPGSSSAPLTIPDFMRLAPLDLVARFELTSVITVQRIVFFRFLIEALASEKANVSVGVNSWWPRSTGKPSSTSRVHQRRASEATVAEESTRTPQRSAAKSRKKKQPDKTVVDPKPPAEQHDNERTEAESEAPVQSTHASQGSVGSPRLSKHEETAAVEDKASESSCSDFTKLYRSLTVALGNLVQAQPWLVEDDDPDRAAPTTASAIAMRASFLAAETFQQSLVLLESTGSSASSSVLRKIQEFTDIINELSQPRDAVDIPPPEYAEPQQPTPFRESTKAVVPPPVQRRDSTSSIFPPPYVATTPSYWTFDPALPAPSTPTDNTGSSSIPRSVAKPKASPGVGDYDLGRSDKLTFLQRRGFTFAKSGLEPVAESSRTPTPKRRPPHRDRANSTDSSASTEPPAYTHWASATIADDRKTERRLVLDDNVEEDEDGADVETRVREALRIQQSFALDDMVQSLLRRGRPTVSARAKATPRPHSAASQAPSRVVSRVRSATARARPKPQPQPPAYTKKPKHPTPPPRQPITQPPRDYEPPTDDAHLHWAARVSEFYQAKLKAVVASSGASYEAFSVG